MAGRSILLLTALVVGLAAVGMAGCAGGPRGDAFQPELADGSKAVIYIFRESRAFGGRPLNIYINQELEGELNTGEYLARVVDPGEYFVRAEDGGSAVRQARVNAGDAVYFRVRAGRFGRNVSIDLPETAEGRRLIAGTARSVD